MDTRDARFFAASLREDSLQTIDLHGASSPVSATETLELFLFRIVKHDDVCRVIHGIGTGAMKNAVLDTLEKNPLVEDFQLSPDGGSTIVLLSPIQS